MARIEEQKKQKTMQQNTSSRRPMPRDVHASREGARSEDNTQNATQIRKAPRSSESSNETLTDAHKKKRLRSSDSGKGIEAEGLIRIKSGVDRPFLIIVIILVAIGTIMVFAVSP